MRSLKTMLAGQTRTVTLLVIAGFVNAALILLLNRGYAGMLDAALALKPSGIMETALALVGVVLINGILSVAQYGLYGWIAESAGHTLRARAAARLLGAECAAHQHRHTGDSLSRVNLELKQATDWLRGQFCPMVIEGAVMLSVFSAMLLVNWRLAAAALAAVPLIAWYAIRASKPIGQAANDRQAALAESNALVKSVVDAFPVIKIFDMKALMGSKYGKAMDRAVGLAVRANSVERLLMTINGLSSLIPLVIVLGYGGAMVIGGGMTAGVLLAFLNLSNFITGPLMNLPGRIAAARAFSANLARVEELEACPMEHQRLVNRRLKDMSNGNELELGNVCFAYEEGQPVLRQVSLAVPQGRRVALVGPSGCGKSTVIKLLAALYMPQEGHAALQGRDTRKWELAELRSRIAVVMQDPFLFPGSMLENITCGNEIPREKVLDACRAAGLSELIESLPDGLETDVGERGAKLSGGQKQRVAIARAIAKDAPILLLDEATSALDSKTEREIQGALDTLMRGRTTLIVTHRLASIRNADRIYCMTGGRITEWGTHDELMALEGAYAGLVKVQGGTAEPGEGGQCA